MTSCHSIRCLPKASSKDILLLQEFLLLFCLFHNNASFKPGTVLSEDAICYVHSESQEINNLDEMYMSV